MAGADREGPDKEKERRYALVAWSIAGRVAFEYWKNFIKIQGENLWKIHRFCADYVIWVKPYLLPDREAPQMVVIDTKNFILTYTRLSEDSDIDEARWKA